MLPSYISGKEFTGTLRGSRVHFRSVEHIDALLGADYYRYETIRALGNDEIRWIPFPKRLSFTDSSTSKKPALSGMRPFVVANFRLRLSDSTIAPGAVLVTTFET